MNVIEDLKFCKKCRVPQYCHKCDHCYKCDGQICSPTDHRHKMIIADFIYRSFEDSCKSCWNRFDELEMKECEKCYKDLFCVRCKKCSNENCVEMEDRCLSYITEEEPEERCYGCGHKFSDLQYEECEECEEPFFCLNCNHCSCHDISWITPY